MCWWWAVLFIRLGFKQALVMSMPFFEESLVCWQDDWVFNQRPNGFASPKFCAKIRGKLSFFGEFNDFFMKKKYLGFDLGQPFRRWTG